VTHAPTLRASVGVARVNSSLCRRTHNV
jgi:hypothetical protein